MFLLRKKEARMADKSKLRVELEERLERMKRPKVFPSDRPALAPVAMASSPAPLADPLISDRARRLIREEQRVAEERRRAAQEERRTEQESEKADKAARGLFRNSRSWFQKPRESKERPVASAEVTPGSSTSWLNILIIILGVIQYFLRVSGSTTEPSTFVFFLSLALFILAGFSLAHFAKKDRLTILLPMLAFVIWYFVYGGNYDPRFLTYFLSFCVLAFGLPIVFTKGESIAALLLGFIPVLFLFLDIGLVAFLVERLRLPVTPLLQNLILFMPWWALFGIVTLPGKVSENSSINFMMNAARIIGILYLVFVLIAPAFPNFGYDKTLLPEAGEFESAQARLRGALPQRENPAYSNLICLFSEFTNVQACVEQRQQNSEIEYICEHVEGKQKGTSGFTECIAQQRKLRQEGRAVVGGVIDPTIKEPTKAELIVNKEALPQQYNPALAFPVELKIENPRRQNIKAEVSCAFVGKAGTQSVLGRIEGTIPLEFNDPASQSTFLCYPEAPLQGNYRLIYNASLSGLTTLSTLQRAFIGNKSPEEKERLRREEVSQVITEDESKSPADFAVIVFDVGHARKEIIIENKPYRTIVLNAFIQNKGPGKIVSIHNYAFDLPGFSVDNPQCLQGSLPTAINYPGSSIPLPQCLIRDYPEELKNPRDWVPHTFTATLAYDYRLTKEVDLTIKLGGEVPS